MDIDGVLLRVAKVERFLDAVQPGWRDDAFIESVLAERAKREGGFVDKDGDGMPDGLEVDHEKTNAERAALGYDPLPAPGAAPQPAEVSADLVVDEDQTKADRIALGYDVDPNADDENGTKQDALDGDGGPKADAWTAPDGNVWKREAQTDGTEQWVTGEDANRQQFIGSREELEALCKAPD